jgi:AraC family transcriptional regulator
MRRACPVISSVPITVTRGIAHGRSKDSGSPPHVWLTGQRMMVARRLLADPHISISEIALAVGYATPSAFSATFRKIVGVTPGGFRRSL